MPYKDPEKKRANRAEYNRESRAFWKSQHRCTDCHEQDAFTIGGRSRCGECNEKRRVYNLAYRRAHSERINARNREVYAERKTAGLCVECEKKLENRTFSRCPACRAKDAAAHRKGSMKGVGDFCAICGKEKAEHGKLCPACYAMACANLEKGRAVQVRDNHPWMRDESLRIMSITGRTI